jgi:UMF1 family MFS transporter
MLGKFAVVLGPFLVGWVGRETGSARIGMMTIIVLFVLGALLLSRVDVDEGSRLAGNR